MTEQQHAITPPPELVEQWINEPGGLSAVHVATQAARWGADQELDACIDVILAHPGLEHPELLVEVLRAIRRPEPPSLAEEALKALQDQIDTSFKLSSKAQERVDLICAALERLQELEEGNE